MNDARLYGVVCTTMWESWQRDTAAHGPPRGVCWRDTSESAHAVASRCRLEAKAFYAWQKKELAEGAEDRPDWEARLIARRRGLLDYELPDHEDQVIYFVVSLAEDPSAGRAV